MFVYLLCLQGYCTKPSLFDFCPVVLPGQPCTNTVGPQSICVENSDQDSSVIANCVVHRCVQVEGSDLMAFTLTINGMWIPHDGILPLFVFVCFS